jgi:GTP cyclohydrolase I
MEPNTQKIESLVRQLLVELGEDPEREGLVKTPLRVAKALAFLTHGYRTEPEEVINQALFTQTTSGLVIVKDIELYSLCEHHMLPFFGRCHIGYIPNGKVFCMMMRGVEKQNSTMLTSSVLGVFREHLATREEFLSLVGRR